MLSIYTSGEMTLFFSPVASNARGITILIKNSFSYHIHDTKAVLGNDALLLDMSIENMRITLAAIYGPNKDSPEFFTSLQEEIKSFKNRTVVICGDYNVVLNYDLDTYKYINKNNPKAQERLKSIMEDNGYHDRRGLAPLSVGST